MIRHLMERRCGAFVAVAVAAAAMSVVACGSTASPAGGASGPTSAAVGGGGTAPSPSDQAGKPLASFNPCSVMKGSDLVDAITAEAGDPSALGTLAVTETPEDGPSNAGLPGSKACQQSWTTTDSAGRVSEGGEPPMVLFEQYSNLKEFNLNGKAEKINDYEASGAQAFSDGAGGAYITKDGYLFHMQGNSDTSLLKVLALGIAQRL